MVAMGVGATAGNLPHKLCQYTPNLDHIAENMSPISTSRRKTGVGKCVENF
jgi:hypothetical protein